MLLHYRKSLSGKVGFEGTEGRKQERVVGQRFWVGQLRAWWLASQGSWVSRVHDGKWSQER